MKDIAPFASVRDAAKPTTGLLGISGGEDLKDSQSHFII